MRSRLLLAAVLLLAPFGASAAPIVLPLKTWVARTQPAPGVGPCPGGCKHMRIAYNPNDGRLWFCGGDYTTSGVFLDSGRQELFSYSIADDSWRLESPYCPPSGAVQPSHPDEVGWAFDSNRNIFWMIPGYMGVAGGGDGGNCPNGTTGFVRWEIMTFNPGTGRWDWPSRTEYGYGLGINNYAQYDRVTDTIIQLTQKASNGDAGAAVYNIGSNTWTEYWTPANNAHISQEYTAMDAENRCIYTIDVYAGALIRYDIDTRVITTIPGIPPGGEANQVRIAWDSVSKVLLWAQWGGSGSSVPSSFRFYAFKPTTSTWEALPYTLPADGQPVYGNNVAFDPVQNAFLLMGGIIDEARPYFYLFRYGNGSGAPSDSIPPMAVQDIRPR